MTYPFLLAFRAWHTDPAKYMLVYAESEDAAKIQAADECFFNSGAKAKPTDILSLTINAPKI